MDELIGLLTSKVGLTAEQGQQTLGVVMGFMKDKLPADLMNQIGTAFPDVGKMLGDASGAVAGAAGAATDAASGAAGAATGAATGAASGAADAATDAAGGVMDSVKSLFGKS